MVSFKALVGLLVSISPVGVQCLEPKIVQKEPIIGSTDPALLEFNGNKEDLSRSVEGGLLADRSLQAGNLLPPPAVPPPPVDVIGTPGSPDSSCPPPGPMRTITTRFGMSFVFQSPEDEQVEDQVVASLVRAYNELNDANCDPFHRRLVSLSVLDSNNSASAIDAQGCQKRTLTFAADFTCEGCSNETPLFGTSLSRRRLEEQSGEDGPDETFTHNYSHRQLQSLSCPCSENGDPVPSDNQGNAPQYYFFARAPTSGELEWATLELLESSPASNRLLCKECSPERAITSTVLIRYTSGSNAALSDADQQVIALALVQAYNRLTFLSCETPSRVLLSARVNADASTANAISVSLTGSCSQCNGGDVTSFFEPGGVFGDINNSNQLGVAFRDTLSNSNVAMVRNVQITALEENGQVVMENTGVIEEVGDSVAEEVGDSVVVAPDTVEVLPCDGNTIQLTAFSKRIVIEVEFGNCLNPSFSVSKGQEVSRLFLESYATTQGDVCDPQGITLSTARVTRIGGILRDGNILPIEILVTGTCVNCFPDTVDIYDVPGTDGLSFGGATATTCLFCDESQGRRSPFEVDVLSTLSSKLQAGSVDCVLGTVDCTFGTPFEASTILSFMLDENMVSSFNSQVDATLASFLGVYESLTQPATDFGACETSFRAFSDVKISTAFQPGSLGRRLLNSNARKLQLSNDESSEDTARSPSTGPTITPSPTITHSPTNVPTLSPTFADYGGVVYVLLNTNGVCRGCTNDLFLGNEVSGRRVEETSDAELLHTARNVSERFPVSQLSPTTPKLRGSSDMEEQFLRRMQTSDETESNCYCPLDSTFAEVPSAGEFSTVLGSSLQDAGINGMLLDAATVVPIPCPESLRRFTSTFSFEFYALSSLSTQDLIPLAQSMEDLYNSLAGDGCDLPLHRQDIQFWLVSFHPVQFYWQPNQPDTCAHSVKYRANFGVQGLCQNCVDGSTVFTDEAQRGLTGNRRLERQVQHNDRRGLQVDDTCYCRIDRSIPSSADFLNQLESSGLLSFPICGIREPSNRDPKPATGKYPH